MNVNFVFGKVFFSNQGTKPLNQQGVAALDETTSMLKRRCSTGNKFEQLALWYLRLNGSLMVSDLVLDPDTARSEMTDADLLAVMFPCSREVAGTLMRRNDILVPIRIYTLK